METMQIHVIREQWNGGTGGKGREYKEMKYSQLHESGHKALSVLTVECDCQWPKVIGNFHTPLLTLTIKLHCAVKGKT